MEIQAKDIAKLVLGYLREEKCHTAFEEFLKTSKYLKDPCARFQKGKPIVTRLCGMNLVGFLTEYSLIYTIVLEHIELTDYHINNPAKHTTLTQLLHYLLGTENETPDNSPINDSNDVPDASLNVKDTANTTADKYTNTDTENSFTTPDKCIPKEVFTQSFLENRKLHKKLADTINRTVSEFTSSPEINSSKDLDYAIKRIVKNTEEDPIFNQLLDEILIVNAPDEVNNDNQNPEDMSNGPLQLATPPTTAVDLNDDDNIRQRLRSCRKLIDFQNEAVVDSIVAAANLSKETEEMVQAELCNTDSNQNNPNTNSGLLMLQPSTSSVLTTFTKSTQVDTTPKPYCLIGTQPYIGVPQLNTVFTEQDILKMPIFVCDTSQVSTAQTIMNITSAPVSDISTSCTSSQSSVVNIAPKPVKKPQTLSEYIKLYNCNDPSPIKKIKSNKCNNKSKNKSSKGVAATAPVEIVVEVVPELQTPEVVVQDNKEIKSRSSPHSGSHIRQLDFSTPDKMFASKALQGTSLYKTPESNKTSNAKVEQSETPAPASTTSAVSNNSTSLNEVMCEEVIETTIKKTTNAETSNGIKAHKSKLTSWDADLRASTGVKEPVKSTPAKLKRKRSSADSLNDGAGAPKKTKECVVMKTSENEVIQISDMIVSPVKTNKSTVKTGESREHNFHILNRNAKPRYKKKCNIDNPDKRHFPITEHVVITSITKVASCEIMDVNNKVVLSPSKMNAGKRNLIKLEPMKDDENTSSKQPIVETSKHSSLNPKTFPLLETPIKNDTVLLPKTPDLNNLETNTPFTRAVIDQLVDVNFDDIQTPKFPITPSFGLTPCIGKDQSPATVRGGTDYSTSSSYYQPSDVEQSKSLEQLIEECKQTENALQNISQPVTNKLQTFNQNLVGRKDLEMLKSAASDMSISSDSSSETDSESSNSSESNSSSTDDSKEVPDTSSEKRYCFRPRKNAVKYEPEPVKKFQNTYKEKLLLEMEEKRQRTIARFKSSPSKVSTSNVQKPKNVTLPRKSTSTAKKPTVPRKRTPAVTKGKAIVNNKVVQLHLSSDEGDLLEPFDIVETNLGDSSSTPIPESPKQKEVVHEDQSADLLVKGLKKWGIHLVPNKKKHTTVSPKKDARSTKASEPITNNAETTTIDPVRIPTAKTSKKINKLPKLLRVKVTSGKKTVNCLQKTPSTEYKGTTNSKQYQRVSTEVPIDTMPKKNNVCKPDNIIGTPKEVIKSTGVQDMHLASNSSNVIEAQAQVDLNISDVETQVTLKVSEARTRHNLYVSEAPAQAAVNVLEAQARVAVNVSKVQAQPQVAANVSDVQAQLALTVREAQAQEGTHVLEVQAQVAVNALEVQDQAGVNIPDPQTQVAGHILEAQAQVAVIALEVQNQVAVCGPESQTQVAINGLETHAQLALKVPEVHAPTVLNVSPGTKTYNLTSKVLQETETIEITSDESFEIKTPPSLAPMDSETKTQVQLPSETSCELKKHQLPLNMSSACTPEAKLVIEPIKDLTHEQKKTRIAKQTTGKSDKHFKDCMALNQILKEGEVISNGENKKKSRHKSISKSRSHRHSNSSHHRHRSREYHSKTKHKEKTNIQQEPKDMFSVKTFENETVHLTHDYNKTCTRTLADYNLNILSKTISASVYLNEHDLEVTKLLTFTPTEFFFEIPSRDKTNSDKEKDTTDVINEKFKPLNILYNSLVKPASSCRQTSTLDGLYPDTSTKYKCSSSDIQHKIAERRNSSKHNEAKEAKRQRDKSKESKKQKSPKRSKTVEKEDENFNTVQPEPVNLNLTADGVPILNSMVVEERLNMLFDESDLMDYAAVGSIRTANSDEFEMTLDSSISSSKDNKLMASNVGSCPKEDNKNTKAKDTAACQELLQNIDVESFLKKLHGDS